MTRFIDANHVLGALNIFNDRTNGNEHFINGIETAKEIVQDAPIVDAIPVEWLAQKARQEDIWGNIPYSEHIKMLIWEWHQEEDDEQEDEEQEEGE